jgi:hypothetical protein
MAIKEVTPQQAHDILNNDTSAVYTDVRTEREFASGHSQGAVNIPVAFPDPAPGMMVNENFVTVIEENFSRQENHRRVPGRAAFQRRGGFAAAGRISGCFEHARRLRRHARPNGQC